jgi:hypothetical protein
LTPENIRSAPKTTTDRAALDWAIFRDIPHGGWCPKGRKAEDGKIPPQYQLTETPSASYLQRTEWNVRDSDGKVNLGVAASNCSQSTQRRLFLSREVIPSSSSATSQKSAGYGSSRLR